MNIIRILLLAFIAISANCFNYKYGRERHTNETSIRFFIIGDWGGQTKPPFVTVAQQKCAALMQNMSAITKPHFFISTGDNFYENGVQTPDDPRFQATFDDVYVYGKSESIPWYVVAGNHDWIGNIYAQVEYSKHNDRWIFPSLFYSVKYYGLGDDRPSAKFVFIDTVVLCGKTRDKHGINDNESTNTTARQTRSPMGPEDQKIARRMWAWIEDQLKESKEKYLFVIGHYPVFSVEDSAVTECFVPTLQDLLVAYNATAYISGHAHDLQHMTTVSSTSDHVLHYVISGAGRMMESPVHFPWNITDNHLGLTSHFIYPKLSPSEVKEKKKKKKKSKRKKTGGFVYADVGARNGTMEYYKCDGTLLYSFRFEPRFTE